MTTPRTLVVLTTGGTIASRVGTGGAVEAATNGAELIDSLTRASGLPEHLTLEVEEVLLLPSPEITPAHMLTLAQRVEHHAARAEVHAVVVTHGTDTMEETALFVDLIGERDKAVIFTGAQLIDSEPGFDGPANLASALRLAADLPQRRHTLLLMGERVVAARGARKAHTTALEPYAGPAEAHRDDLGAIGSFPVSAAWADAHELPALDVPLLTLYAGISGRHVAALADSRDGLVVAGFGMAAATAETAKALTALARTGTFVCATTRCDSGPVHAKYGQGGALDLLQGGVVLAAGLRPVATRLAVHLALAVSGGGRAHAVQLLASVCDVQG